MSIRDISASMLYNYAQCPHRVSLDLFEDRSKRDAISPFVELLWTKGQEYEQEVIDNLGIDFENLRVVSEDHRASLTLQAMSDGKPLIYGGRITVDNLVGEPDLLRKQDDGYVAGDIKSGAGLEGQRGDIEGRPKLHYAVQLGMYTDILNKSGFASSAPPFIWDIHRNEVSYDLNSSRGPRIANTMWEEYETVLLDVQAIIANELITTPAMSSTCKLCHWYSHCKTQLLEADDLTIIPGLGRARREKLESVVTTVEGLAELEISKYIEGDKSKIKGVGAKVLSRYHARAQLIKDPNAVPYFQEKVVFPSDDVELFFDVEADPMRDICYLHGFILRKKDDGVFYSFYADKPDDRMEEQAFANAWEFINDVKPTAIYYYAPYEKTTLKNLSIKYPTIASEDDVINLFESEIMMDLYNEVVRSKMIWPTHDLSIKTLARFCGFEWRDEEPSGAASIEWYHRWVESEDPSIKQRILEYNEDDCRAMCVFLDEIKKLSQ